MTAIILSMLQETLKAMIGKMLFAAVGERFLSRIVCYSMRRLAKMTSNTLDDELAEEIIQTLKRPELPKMK